MGGKKKELFFLCCSPSICHSDSDLSEGSRKYSPSSETSLETQRACGKAQTHRRRSYASKNKKQHPSSNRLSQKWKIIHLDKQFSQPFTPFFICAIAEGSSCSHLPVPFFFFFCLLFCLFLPPASLRRLLRDVLRSLRL